MIIVPGIPCPTLPNASPDLERLNIQVAKKVNEIFDIIISGNLNYSIFQKEIDENKLVRLKNKSDMEEMLVTQTQVGDLILFANDAPSFI